jgi:hypothetical protein
MSDILKDLASRHNMTANRTQAWGEVDGYWFQIALPSYGSNVLKVRTAMSLADEAAKSAAANGLADMASRNPEISYTRDGGTVVLSMKMPMGDSAVEKVDSVLLRLASIFRQAGATPACFNCGSDRPDSFAMVNGTAMKLCSGCEAGIEGSITKQTEEYSVATNNYLKGFIGALIGALLGSLVWILIGYLGYIAAIGGVAISFFAIKGYQMMKGKITTPAILGICLVCLAAVALAQFALLDIELCKSIISQGKEVDYGKLISYTFQLPFMYPEETGPFMRNLGLGVLFLALGSWRLIRSLHVNAKAPAGKFERI